MNRQRFATAARHDLRQLWRDRAIRGLLIALAAIVTISAWNGASIVREHRAGLAHLFDDTVNRQDRASSQVPIPTIRATALLPDGPVSSLSLGRIGVDPANGEFTFVSRADQLFRNYQTNSPAALAAGAFDLGFVVIVIFPLFAIALGHGVLASDRDAGRLRTIMAAGMRPTELLAARLLVRATAVALLIVIAAPLSVFLVDGLAFKHWGALLAWVVIATLYMALWWGAVAVVAAARAKSSTLAIGLVALWVLLTIIGPALVAQGTDLAIPAPSRTAFDADIRRAQTAMLTDFSGHEARIRNPAYQATKVPPLVKRAVVSRRLVDKDYAARARAFDEVEARRTDALSTAGLLIPAIGFDRALTDVAGTGRTRYAAFRRAARAWQDSLQARLTDSLWSGMTVPAAEGRLRLTYAYRERVTRLGPLIVAAAAVLVLLLLAGWRARDSEL